MTPAAQARRRLGISRRAVAARYRVSVRTVARWEQGDCPFGVAEELARWFGCNLLLFARRRIP